jgi:monoamine oxidase
MHDLIIVGGGLAGLALAARSVRAGANVVLLEARDRLGGRVLAHQTRAGHYDLGPAWIWPRMQPRLRALVAQAGLHTYPQNEAGGLMFEDASGTIQRFARGFGQEPPSLRVVGGISALIDGLSAGLAADQIKLSTPVERLHLASDHVRVLTERGEFAARHVALAMPPRLAAALTFEPSLPPALLASLQSVPTWMAGQAKALAIYRTGFWRDVGLSGSAMSQIGPLGEIHDASLPGADEAALFGFFAWSPAQRAARQDMLADAVCAQLGRLFGPSAAQPEALVIRDWATDHWTSTSLDHAPLREHPSYRPIDWPRPWGDRVLLAGSEAAADFGGYLEGALAAAASVAEKISINREFSLF